MLVQTEKDLKDKGLEKDHFTEALLRGIHPEDGCGAGTPFITEGDGNCLLNAVAQLFLEKKQRGIRNDVKTLAAKLRLSIFLEGIRHMETYLSRQEDFFMGWANYVSDVREKVANKGWSVAPEVDNNMRVSSRRGGRLLFVAQLHHIASNRTWLQQFVFPMLATVTQSPLRAFLPCEYHHQLFFNRTAQRLFKVVNRSPPLFRPCCHSPTLALEMARGVQRATTGKI